MGNHMTRATLLCHQQPGCSLAVTCSLCTSRVKDSVGCLKRPRVPRPARRGLAGPSLRSCRLDFQGLLWCACQSSVQLRMHAPAPAWNLWPPGYPSTSSLCSLPCCTPPPFCYFRELEYCLLLSPAPLVRQGGAAFPVDLLCDLG